MKIGEIKEALKDVDKERTIRFDFGFLSPSTIDSWRGNYANPAIGYAMDEHCTVQKFLDELYLATSGKLYYGYKGGEFTFSDDCILWVDNYGQFSETAIHDITVLSHVVIIETKHDYY